MMDPAPTHAPSRPHDAVPADATARATPRPGTSPIEPRPAGELPPALRGERVRFGDLCCYVAGQGPPLVLIHGMNVSPSAAEVRPLFDRYAASRTVFALDLPGCGFSDRIDRHYDPRLMTDALHALAEQVRLRCGEARIDALAVSTSCEFLARAAMERPERWRCLAFVSPTGLDGQRPRRAPRGRTRAVPGLHALLSARPWAQALYRTLTRPGMVRHFMRRSFGGRAIDETLWAYGVRNATVAGSRFAPLHFLSGGLFSADIHDVYESLTQPVWVSHGVRGDFTDYRALRLLGNAGRWRVSTFQAGALPYFEVMTDFARAFDAFLRDGARGRGAPDRASGELARDAFRERSAGLGRR
jgi:pimeloyl-ACP methyl ester carboxylesterase